MEKETTQHAEVTARRESGHGAVPATGPDWLLERWLRLAELGIEVGVTLQMGGLLISGTLVGARRYLEHQRSEVLSSLVERGLPPLIARKLDRAFAADLQALADADQAEQAGVESSREFIHLKDACVVTDGGHRHSFVVPYWRGQLRRVDAFFLGSAQQASD